MHIALRLVDVNDEALVQSRCVDRIAVFDVVGDIEIFKCGRVAVARSVAFVNLSE